jgi:hypothetical protein
MPLGADTAPCGLPSVKCNAVLVTRLGTSVADMERQLIQATLQHYGGKARRTAVALDISLRTLYSRLKAYGMVDMPGTVSMVPPETPNAISQDLGMAGVLQSVRRPQDGTDFAAGLQGP